MLGHSSKHLIESRAGQVNRYVCGQKRALSYIVVDDHSADAMGNAHSDVTFLAARHARHLDEQLPPNLSCMHRAYL